MKTVPDLVRSCFKAYETGDRALIESLLADDFTFSSPVDDAISRERYFERCWPNHKHHLKFNIVRLFAKEDGAFVTYEGETTDGSRFHNTEYFEVQDDKIKHVDVYFGSESGADVDDEEIRLIIEAWAEAIRRKDVHGVLRHFADESVRFYLAPPLQATMPVKDNLEGWFATFEGDIGYEIRDLTLKTGHDLVCAHSLNHMSGTKTDGEKVDLWFRETLCLQKNDGHWRIAHAHESVPFEMDSKRAALDLKP